MMRKNIVIALGVFMLLIFRAAFSFAAADPVGEGYDENTEIVIKGSVIDIDADGRRGPVVIKIASGGRIYNVATAPAWYLVKNGIVFHNGEDLEVTGARYLSRDGVRYIIAKQIKNISTGITINFRDPQCKPMWRGSQMRSRGLW